MELGNLDASAAEQLLENDGVDAAAAPRVNRVARGHPLSLESAAAAVRARLFCVLRSRSICAWSSCILML
jgi:hypothetical protein